MRIRFKTDKRFVHIGLHGKLLEDVLACHAIRKGAE